MKKYKEQVTENQKLKDQMTKEKEFHTMNIERLNRTLAHSIERPLHNIKANSVKQTVSNSHTSAKKEEVFAKSVALKNNDSNDYEKIKSSMNN